MGVSECTQYLDFIRAVRVNWKASLGEEAKKEICDILKKHGFRTENIFEKREMKINMYSLATDYVPKEEEEEDKKEKAQKLGSLDIYDYEIKK